MEHYNQHEHYFNLIKTQENQSKSNFSFCVKYFNSWTCKLGSSINDIITIYVLLICRINPPVHFMYQLVCASLKHVFNGALLILNLPTHIRLIDIFYECPFQKRDFVFTLLSLTESIHQGYIFRMYCVRTIIRPWKSK